MRGGGPASLDVLSDVLEGVRLNAALFFCVEASSPWVAEAPAPGNGAETAAGFGESRGGAPGHMKAMLMAAAFPP